MIALRDSLGSDFIEEVRSLFSKNGSLAQAKNFEYRPQQQEMAVAVARSLEGERHLVVEAGTGVGKSIAYLAPAILYAIAEKKKAVISTHTINLQEQLLYKDIPILKKILPIEFEAALMKGRQNYLCPRRLERALQQAGELFTTSEAAELARIAEWARRTKDGSLSDLAVEPDPKVWTQVCSEAHICTGKTCGQQSNCFFQQARKRLLAADVIVLNHTLLFMLLGPPEEQQERDSGYLFPNDFIVFDEAHTIEQTASRQIGLGVSQYGLRATVQRLYNARTRKGLFTVTRDAAGVTLAAAIVDEIDRFFHAIDERCDFRKGREVRVREPDFVPDTISGRLIALQARVAEVVKRTEDEFLKAELQELGRRIHEARIGIVTFLEQSAEGHVYWVERTGKAAQFLTLNAAPIDIAPVLRRMIFRDDCSCVLTSATLAVGRPDLAYFRDRIGAGSVEPLQLGSPFDFPTQMKLFVVRKMPDPRDAGYAKALAHWVAHFVTETEGRAFVLFTSYRGMQQLAEEMQSFFAENRMNLLVQGQGAPRGEIARTIQDDAAQRSLRDR